MLSTNRRSAAARKLSRRNAFLNVESLEERTVLAGNVLATVNGGNLQLIGDAQANQLEITRVGSSSVQITSLDNTTINGQAGPITLTNVTKNISAVLGDGDDVLQLTGNASGSFRIFGNVSIDSGNGNDIIRLNNFETWGVLNLNTGAGDDQVIADVDPNNTLDTNAGLQVLKPAIINTGTGNDTVSLAKSNFSANVNLDLGAGDDQLDVHDSIFSHVTQFRGGVGTDSLTDEGNTFKFKQFVYSFEDEGNQGGPTATNDTATVAEGGSIIVNVLGNDVATNGTLNAGTVQVVQNPLHGTAVVNANGTITYTNNGSESSTDLFTYTVRDSQGNLSNVGTVNVTVTPVNDAPTIGNIANVTANEDATLAPIALNIADAETAANALTVTATSNNQALISNANIALSGTGSTRLLTLTPTANATGTATITVSVTDANNLTTTKQFTVTLNPLNDLPTITPISDMTVNAGASIAPITLTVGDTETPASNLTVSASSSNQALVANSGLVLSGTGANRTLTITPVANATGNTTITVRTTDANGASVDETFVLTVLGQNNTVPTISAINDVSINANTATNPLSFTVGDTETAAANLQVTAASSNTSVVPLSGITLSGTGANRTVVVTPTANATGSSTITLTVTDASGATSTEQFVVNVGQNSLPTISAISDVNISPSTSTTPISFTVGDTETAAANLQVTATSSNTSLVPLSGITISGTGANRTVVVTPTANLSGSSTITLTVTDAGGATSTEQFVVNVGQNALPTISAISDVTVGQSTATNPISFTIGDTESAAANLQVTAASSNTNLVPVSGISISGTGANRTVVVTPLANVAGSSTITLTVTDEGGATSTEQFVVNVSPNALPTISAVSDVTISQNTSTAPISFTIGDAETAAANLQVSANSSNTSLIPLSGITISGSGANRTITITPLANVAGTSIITLMVTDANGLTAMEQFAVNVTL